MNTARLRVSLLLFVCLLIPAISQAESKARAVTFSPMLGGTVMEGDQNLDNGLSYSLGLGYNLTESFALEAVYAGANLEDEDSGDDVDLNTYRLDAVYHFLPENRLVPYLAVGGGLYNLDGDSEFMVDGGGGLLFYFAENMALRADVRYLGAFNESRLENNLLYTAGFKIQFAGVTKPAEAVPLDSDGDGVTDDLDKCPGTPRGVPVDASGCPLDSDGDGVTDDLDQCPDTPRGAPVDATGCPLDSDGDGVFDYLDQCPDTLKGMPVDEKGCDLRLTLHINFDTDQAVIKPEFRPELKKAAEFVRAHPDVPYIVIAGHTDNIGDADYNLQLSERRATAVRRALIQDFGLDGDRLQARGYGETAPVATNSTAEGRYQNRRVELICCGVLPE